MRLTLPFLLLAPLTLSLARPIEDATNTEAGHIKWHNHKWTGTDGKECWGKERHGCLRIPQNGKRFKACLEGVYQGPEDVRWMARSTEEWYRQHTERLGKGAEFPEFKEDEKKKVEVEGRRGDLREWKDKGKKYIEDAEGDLYVVDAEEEDDE